MGEWADLGYEHLYNGDFDKALEHFRKGAEQGDPQACYGIVELYESCKPTDLQSSEDAKKEKVNMCARAMLLGHDKEPYTLSRIDSEWKLFATAYCKEKGIGYAKDVLDAISLYEQDAEQGGYHSILRLYQIYKDGIDGISIDEVKAARYLLMIRCNKTVKV